MLYFEKATLFILFVSLFDTSFGGYQKFGFNTKVFGGQRYAGITGFSLEIYHPFDEIIDYMKNIGNHYAMAQYVEIGTTPDGLPISVIEIKAPSYAKGNPDKPIVMIECGIHAREWVSTSTCLYIMNDILKNKPSVLLQYDFHLLPVLNPEGYVYSWTRMRSWRKNRSKNASLTQDCYGVDLNRNFDADFCQNGASKVPCELDYCGESAFSEVETRILRDYVLKIKDQLIAYFSLHNFGQFLMYPYAYTDKPAPNDDRLSKLAKLAVNEIKRVGGQDYTHGPVSQIMYKSSGSSIDWVYDNTDCKIVFVMELRDNGVHGFRLPDKFIKPTAVEAWAAIKIILENIYS